MRRKRLYPTQEVLLKHAVHSLHMAAEVDGTEHYVDNVEYFLADMTQLSAREQGCVVQLFVLTSILDGSFSKSERRLYRQLCGASDDQFQPHESYIRYCAQRLRSSDPIRYRDLRHCVYWDDDGALQPPWHYHAKEMLHFAFAICTC